LYRVAVIDDEELIREGMKNLIESFDLELSVVATASNGLEMMNIYRKYIPDIMIVDINIPNKNGLDCINEIRKTNTTSIIIIVSGYDKFEYAKRAIENDVDFYLLKPVDDDEFYEIMKESIDKFNINIENENIISKHKNNLGNNDKSVIEYINANYTFDELSSELVENKFNLSRSALYKIIKTATGRSFIEYITMLRINYAKRLLKEDKLSIKEIAASCGYSDQYYFSRVFKKNVGYSPTEYKEILIGELDG